MYFTIRLDIEKRLVYSWLYEDHNFFKTSAKSAPVSSRKPKAGFTDLCSDTV